MHASARRVLFWTVLITLLVPVQAGHRPAAAAPASTPSVTAVLPLLFIENVGQYEPAVRFLVWGGSQTVLLTDQAIWFVQRDVHTGQAHAVRLTFHGASPNSHLQPLTPLPTLVNEFRGNDPTHWRTHIPTYAGVRYVNLYPGLDLDILGEQGVWAWKLRLHDASADPARLQLRFEGVRQVHTGDGFIHLETTLGGLTLPPIEVPGSKYAAGQVRRAGSAVFEVSPPQAPARPAVPRIIQSNPEDLVISTLLGGSGDDTITDMAVDFNRNIYLAGNTSSADFPISVGAFDTTYNGGGDGFLAKLNPVGSSLIFATFFGGTGNDLVTGMTLDLSTQISVTLAGHTDSTNFPVSSNAYQPSNQGGVDAFVLSLSTGGDQILYATYLGGTSSDYTNAISLDAQGNAYLTGWTNSNDFPVSANAYDNSWNGAEDAFLAQLSADGRQLLYATYLGGSKTDIGYAVVTDGSGAVTVGGLATSPDFPVQNAAQGSMKGLYDAFLTRIQPGASPPASQLVFSTYLGGILPDEIRGVTVDGYGDLYAVGTTYSPDFMQYLNTPLPAALDGSQNGSEDVFVLKMDPDGNPLAWTFLGGDSIDRGYAIAVDRVSRQPVVVGETSSANFPRNLGSFDIYHHGAEDGFLVRLAADFSRITYGSFLGGNLSDIANAVATDLFGGVYVAGQTDSSDFPTLSGGYDTTANGGSDGFLIKLGMRLKYQIYLPMIER